jgi:hypothetical protein
MVLLRKLNLFFILPAFLANEQQLEDYLQVAEPLMDRSFEYKYWDCQVNLDRPPHELLLIGCHRFFDKSDIQVTECRFDHPW